MNNQINPIKRYRNSEKSDSENTEKRKHSLNLGFYLRQLFQALVSGQNTVGLLFFAAYVSVAVPLFHFCSL